MKQYKHTRFYLLFLFLFISHFASVAQVRPEIIGVDAVLNSNISDSAKTTLLNKIINYYSNRGNDSALVYAKDGLTLFSTHKYKDGQAWMIFAQADNDDTHGSNEPAYEKTLYALNLFQESDDERGMAKAYNMLSELEDKKGNFDKALADLLLELQIFKDMGAKDEIVATWSNIGSVYDDTHDSLKTIEYYRKADSLASLLPISSAVIDLYNNLGVYYFNRQDSATAFKYMKKVLALSDKQEYVMTHIKAVMNMGEMYWTTGNGAEGDKYLTLAMGLTRQYDQPDQQAAIWMNMAHRHTDLPIDTRISYIDSAFELIKKTGNKIRERVVYEAYATLYEQKNDYQDATKYLKAERQLTDSLYSANKTKDLANITTLYDLKLSNDKVHDLEVLIQRNRLQRDIIIGIAALIVVLMVILFYNFRRSRMLNHKLEERQEELYALNNMKDKLFSVIGHDMRGPIANIPIIIDLIESELEIPQEYKQILVLLKEHTSITIETLDKLMLMGQQYIKGDNYHPEVFNPKNNISKNLDLLAFAIKKKNITIADTTAANISLSADVSQFDFVIRNLVSNAIKFSFGGTAVTIAAEHTSQPGFVVFSVADKGTGMDEKTIGSLFNNAVTSSYGTNREKGNGIGLMLCKDFIEQNGGRIWAESTKGEGSTFFFSLKSA